MNRIDNLLLKKFVSTDHKYLERPFIYEGYVMASDGICIIRLPPDAVEDSYEANISERIQFSKPFECSPLLPEPLKFSVADLEITDKATLDNLKWTHGECDTCNGTGTHECMCGGDHVCGDCEGSGDELDSPALYARLAGSAFDYKYIRLIFETAEMFSKGTFEIIATGPLKPTVFRMGKAEIALIPVDTKSKESIDLESKIV